ncbi:MAG TPA: GAF domain-containing protein, partial [Bacteroidetes bacterium]|nr:GAF domain-containing protein [Bacteroidota bacterium]
LLPAVLLFVSRRQFPVRLLPIDVHPRAYYYSVELLATPFALLLTLTALTYLGLALALLLRCRRRATSSRQRRQITSILVGFPAFFLLFLTSWLLAPFRRTAVQIYLLGTGFTVLVSISLWVAAREYGLLRIRRLLAGGLAFTVFSALILAFYLLVLRSLSSVVSSAFGFQSTALDVALVLGLALIVRPAERTLQNLLEQIFQRGVRAYRRELLQLSEDLVDYRGREFFVRRVCRFLRGNFDARTCGFALPQDSTDVFELWTSRGKSQVRFRFPARFKRALVRKGNPVELPDLEELQPPQDFLTHLRNEGVEVVVPLVAQKDLLGILFFGRHRSSGGLDEESLQIVGVLGNELSVTLARNLLIERVEAREREQARADRVDALRRLLAGVAHEIRNPLNTIATAAETLSRREPDDPLVKEMADIISTEADRMNKLLTDFLRLQRVRSPQVREVELRPLLDRVLLGVPEGVRIAVDLPETCQMARVDGQLLEQVLMNLVANAVDSVASASTSAAGVPHVSVRVRCEEDALVLSVEDNGPGIPPDIRNRIFDPFFTTKPEGTGLGLAIVHNIVNVTRGTIRVDSTPGHTVFTVTFPMEGNRGDS